MIPAIGDTLDGRYTLIAQYRSQPGLSAWIARDHALDLDCQIFLLTDQTRIGLVSQIASALVLSRDPRSTAVRRFHSVGDALLVVMEPDPGVALSTLVGKNHRLSIPAMRMVVNELIDTIQSLHSSQVDFHTLVPEVIRLTGSSLVLSAVPLDPYIEPPLVTRARQTSTGNEMLAILQISAILFKMLTGVTFDPHDMETMDQLLLQASYSAQLHGEGLPGDFLTILERALGVRLSSDESQQRPFPIYTLMEMQALLDNPLRPDKLPQEDLALPGEAGTSSATLVRLLPSAQQDLVDIPDSLVSTDTVHNEAGVILPWSRQELFAGTDVQEVDPSGLLGTAPSASGTGAATDSGTGDDAGNSADVSGTGSAIPGSATAVPGSTTAVPSAMTGVAVGATAGAAAGAASVAGNGVTDDETRVFSPISVAGQPVGASGRPDSASSAYSSAQPSAQAGPQSASASSLASSASSSARSAYISEAVNEEKAESTAHTQTVVNHHELSASDSSKFESKEKKAAEKKENPHRLAQGIVIAVVAVAVLVGAIAAVHTLSGSIDISLPWSSQEKDSDVGKHWNIDTSKAPLPGNATQEEKEQAEDSADAKTGSSGSSSSKSSSSSSDSAKSGTSTGTKSSNSSKSSTASTKRTRKRVTEHRTSKGVIIDDKNATAVPKPVQPITNPVQLAFTQRFFTTSDGRGVAISLTKPHKISSVTITLRNQTSAGTGKLYVNSTASNPRNGKPVATFTFASGNQPTQITVSGAPTTQNLVIWIDNASQSGFYYSNLSVMGE
jgi:hypothetical protein